MFVLNTACMFFAQKKFKAICDQVNQASLSISQMLNYATTYKYHIPRQLAKGYPKAE